MNLLRYSYSSPIVTALFILLGGVIPVAADELFVADRATDRILAFDAETGAFTRVLVDEGLNTPSGLAFGPGGFLYVSNLGTGAVLKVNPETGATSPFALIGGPSGLAYDAESDTLFAAEFGNFNGDEVYQFDASGGFVNVIGTSSGSTGRSGLAIRDGDLYAAVFGSGQTFSGSVMKFDGETNYASAGTVAADPGLSGANGLAFDAAGNLYVVGLFSQGVKKFDLSGGPATSGTDFGFPLAYPSSIMIEEQGEAEVMYVTTLGNDNPADPIYGNFLFPGGVYKFDVATGALIGAGPFIESGGASDFNNDGAVDGDDLAIWSQEFGASEDGTADSNADGVVDGADFLIWQRNSGKVGDFQPTAIVRYTPPTDVVSAVPEPATMMLTGIALVSIGLAARSRR
jgi:sugar lactone lactonase YvrE